MPITFIDETAKGKITFLDDEPGDLPTAEPEKTNWIVEGLKETGKEFYRIGARYPKAILAGGEALQQGGDVGLAVKQSFLDLEKRPVTEIAQQMGDYLYHDKSQNMWWEAMKHLPFATLGKMSELFTDPSIFLTFQGVVGVLKDPHVAKYVGKELPAPKWFDNLIRRTVNFSAEPLKTLSKGVRDSRIDGIVRTLHKNVGKRIADNYKKATGVTPTENDVKGIIKMELIRKGIYGKSVIELQAALLRARGIKPTTEPIVIQAAKEIPIKTGAPIKTEVKISVGKLAQKSLTPERIAGLDPAVRAALLKVKLKGAKGKAHRKSIIKKYGEQVVEKEAIDRDVVALKSTVDPSLPATSEVETVSPEVPITKPLPLGAKTVADYPDTALINKSDRATDHIITSINDGIRESMVKAVEDFQKGKHPYTLNPIIDTTIAFQKLEERTGFPLYSKIYTQGIKGRNLTAYAVSGHVNEFTDGLKKGYQDKVSTEKIVNWITGRKGSLTGEEKLIAIKLQKIFRDVKDMNSYLRMRRFIDGAEKVPADFEEMVMQGEEVFAKGGREALEEWVKGKDFGVIRDDRYFPSQLLYRFRTHVSSDPFEVFNPYLHSREAKEQLYDYSQSLTQKLHSYLTRVYSDYYLYDLLRDVSNELSGTTIPFETLKGIKRWLVSIQGKGIDVGWWGKTARKMRGQFFKVTLADPTKMARNYLQRYYMTLMNYPTLQHAIKTRKYFSYKTTDAEKDYFMKHVSQLGELEREQLYLYEKFFEKGFLGKVDDIAVKVAKLYTKIDQGNRWVTYKYALANVDQYIKRYMEGVIDLRGFMSKSGMSSFYPLEIKHILHLPPEKARLEIAKLLVEKTQIRYKKVERGIGALSELGEVSTSLLQYPKGIITRYLDAVDMIKDGDSMQERWDGVRLLVGLILLADIAQETLQAIAGKSKYYDPDLGREVEHDPYAIVGILGSLGIAGAQPAHAITLARLNKRMVWLGLLEARGEMDEKSRMTAIRNILRDADQLGEAYIPFLRISLNSVESLEGTRSHKLLTTWFDQKTNRQSALRRNKIERDWWGKVTHALFGRERGE